MASSGPFERSPTDALSTAFATESARTTDACEPGRRTPARQPAGLSLKVRALACLARREHSRAELARKLAPYAESPDDIERTLDELTLRGFLNDARVVETHIYHRAARRGGARIRAELEQKGIATDLLTPALSALQETEADRAWALWQLRFGSHRAPVQDFSADATPDGDQHADRHERPARQESLRVADQRARARQMRFLLSRGFSAGVVNATLRRADNRDDETPDVADTGDAGV